MAIYSANIWHKVYLKISLLIKKIYINELTTTILHNIMVSEIVSQDLKKSKKCNWIITNNKKVDHCDTFLLKSFTLLGVFFLLFG